MICWECSELGHFVTTSAIFFTEIVLFFFLTFIFYVVFCICTAEVCMSGLSRRTLRQLWYVVCCAWWDYQVHGFAQVIFSAWYLAVFPEPCERRQDVACSLFAKVVCLQQGWLKKAAGPHDVSDINNNVGTVEQFCFQSMLEQSHRI